MIYIFYNIYLFDYLFIFCKKKKKKLWLLINFMHNLYLFFWLPFNSSVNSLI